MTHFWQLNYLLPDYRGIGYWERRFSVLNLREKENKKFKDIGTASGGISASRARQLYISGKRITDRLIARRKERLWRQAAVNEIIASLQVIERESE